MPKLGEPVKEIQDGRFELALGAKERRVDNLLAQKLPPALNQVQVGRIGRQEDLHEVFFIQLGVEYLVFVVAGIIADDRHRALGVGGEQLLVEPLGTLGVDAVGLIEMDQGGVVGIEGSFRLTLS